MIAFRDELRSLIAQEGPITVERYMALCLQRYYASRDPLGAVGDFITAPEISQVFGELIGLWTGAVWHVMGRPTPVRVVELGPGRGTLMADALRAARIVPGFLDGAEIHLVETSAALRRTQEQALGAAGPPVSWHERLDEVPPGPALVLANEFFDALPIRQFIRTDRGWCERLVGLRGAELVFGLRAEPEELLGLGAAEGDVLEWPSAAIALTRDLARRLVREGGAALIIDYGYWGPGRSNTLQAVKRHAYADPLAEPGEADLTAHVDFARLAQAAAAEGAALHGPVDQGAFLRALGIDARSQALQARATSVQAQAVESAVRRLAEGGPEGMGELFQVLCISHPELSSVPGLPSAELRPTPAVTS